MVSYLLRNENYIGNTVYNRQSFRLRARRGLIRRTSGSEARASSPPQPIELYSFARNGG